jgi:hypothetical protein
MLELPTGAAASRGIAEARVPIDMLRRGVGALGGVFGDVDDETDEATELSPGTVVVALTTFPGSTNPAMALGTHISRVDLPTAAVYVAGTKLPATIEPALASASAGSWGFRHGRTCSSHGEHFPPKPVLNGIQEQRLAFYS